MLYVELFLSFLKVGLFSIGGGYAAMPLIKSIVVDKYAWLTVNQFGDLVTIAEMTPGPILVNGATFVGIRVGGIAGAVTATLGSIFPSLVIMSILAYFYFKYREISAVRSILKNIRPTVVALITSAGATILINAVFGSESISIKSADIFIAVLFIAAFFTIRKLKISPILTIFICGIFYAAVSLFFNK